jgi:hypothetical protein
MRGKQLRSADCGSVERWLRIMFGLQSSARRPICRLPVRSMVGRASPVGLNHLAITGLVPLPEPEQPGFAWTQLTGFYPRDGKGSS